MTTSRQILTPIDATLNSYLLTQQQIHGLQRGRVLSLASIVRATLAGCARADFNLGGLEGPDRISAVIAEALSRHATNTSQA